MIHKKKLLPVWLFLLIDVLLIAVYIVGFYGLYYLTPRQLSSSGIKTQQEDTLSTAQETDQTTSGTTDLSSASDTSNMSGVSDTTSISDASDTSNMSNAAGTSDTSNTSGTSEEADTSGMTVNTADSDSQDTSETTNTSVSSESSDSSDNLAEKFANRFTDTVVTTDHSYSSKDISITVDKYTEGSGNNLITYYVADIYIADIKSLQSGFAENTYGVGYTESVLDMDDALDSILTINGDYYGNGGNGVVIRNGEVYRSSTNGSDVCVLYYNGVMKTFSAQEFDVDQAIKDGAWQAWSFGPELLDEDGNNKAEFTADGHVKDLNPRSAIGYYEPGHYCMVVVDGRQRGYSLGMTLTQLSELFEKLGCTSAYNLDGGKSSVMAFNDSLVNQPAQGGREVSDCIIIKEGSKS